MVLQQPHKQQNWMPLFGAGKERPIVMESLQKVHTMIGMAIYDKHLGAQDRRKLALSRRDYVYRRNLGLRLGVGFGYLVLAGLYFGYLLFVKEADVFALFSKQTLVRTLAGLLVVLVVYTVLGTVMHRKEYDQAEARNEIYERKINKLARLQAQERTYDHESIDGDDTSSHQTI